MASADPPKLSSIRIMGRLSNGMSGVGVRFLTQSDIVNDSSHARLARASAAALQ